jgi:N-acyl-D-aspartate/D-glutamate deacylase
MAADLVLFDQERIADRATFEDPTAAPTGVQTALVNGEIVWTAGVPTGRRPGSVILST